MMTPMAKFITAARKNIAEALGRFTTDPAVRVGILQAAWSVAPSFARGLLPRSPSQQAIIVGVNGAAQYALGTTGWSLISSIAAGIPGHHAGPRALAVTAATTGTTSLALEKQLRPVSGENFASATAWAAAKTTATTSLAGGLVLASDLLIHGLFKKQPSIKTTLAIDIGAGAIMATGTLVRRHRRARKFGMEEPERTAVKKMHGAKAYVSMAGISAGTTIAIAGLAVGEQAASRAIDQGLSKLAGRELGETGVLLGHGVTAAALAGLAYVGLQRVRARTARDNEVIEPAYPDPPKSPHVSCGPNSLVEFDDIGKEGRRFVLMTLDTKQISNVMGEESADPVRAVIPREGPVADRALLAVDELERLGGLEKSMIVVASPTGVGYVNYIMAEALEYLTLGNCAIVVPQYAMVPSALALNKTDEGTELQGAILRLLQERLERIPEVRRPRIFQFGESLGAQTALDVAAEGGIDRLDRLGVSGGLYLGVPFRSKAWNIRKRDPDIIDPDGRMVLAPDAEEAPSRPGMHLMLVHHDDPVNMFSYGMVVKRPDWFGRPADRPPKVPREVLFRPIASFVIALIDLMNGMDQRPGQFVRVGHDYRYDMREALEKAYNLRSSKTQEKAIEKALRDREEMWAQARMVLKNMNRALSNISATLDKWGQSAMTLQFAEEQGFSLPALLQQAKDEGVMSTISNKMEGLGDSSN
jgi:uncharacterized membrane protein